MYGAVNRKFKQIFNRQEHMKTFKTYDRIEVGNSDNVLNAMKVLNYDRIEVGNSDNVLNAMKVLNFWIAKILVWSP